MLQWLEEEGVVPITWVKRTSSNVKRLDEVAEDEFVPMNSDMPLGKADKQQIDYVADTILDFPHLAGKRVIVLETNTQKRVGVYTTAPHPRDAPLVDERTMSAVNLMDTMRYKQRIENRFKVEIHELGSDALPSHQTHQATRMESYDLDNAQRQLANAQRRLHKYTAEEEQQQQLHERGQLNRRQLNLLDKRTQRLHHKAEREIETLSQEIAHVQYDQNEQPILATETEVLDVRKLTLLNLFKLHALVALKILAHRLGLPEASPKRLRRVFLAFGDRVEFNHDQRIATVYAHSFPRAQTQQAYEHLCGEKPFSVVHDLSF